MLTDVGPVEITVPRDRDGSFEPKIVKKRQKRLTGVPAITPRRIPAPNPSACPASGDAITKSASISAMSRVAGRSVMQ